MALTPTSPTLRTSLLALLLSLVLASSACVRSDGRFVESVASNEAGTVTWQNCQDEGEDLAGFPVTSATLSCGTLTVPLDWNNPEGDTISIALLRARATGQTSRIGSLLVNPGGPGSSGRMLAAIAPTFLPREVLQQFDIIGFDPRGVGESSPVECASNEFKDAMIALDPDPQTQGSFDAQLFSAREFVAGCLSNKSEVAQFFSTEQTAHDMDAIRDAVGDEKLNYLGYSYGTLLGAVYAHEYPQSIRAMVLDGAVDPAKSDVEMSEGQAAGFESAFDDFAAWCLARSDCDLGPDVRATVEQIRDEIRAEPVPGDERIATVGHYLYAIASAMYVKDAWPLLASGISDIESGDPENIFRLSDIFFGRNDDNTYDNSTDANTLINCVDARPSEAVTPEQVQGLQDQWRTEYPLFGGLLATTLLTCQGWPDDTHDPFDVGVAEGALSIVVVGTTGDPATPYENTAILANMIGVGHVVTQVGEGHTSYPQGSSCLADAVNAYLIRLEAPQIDLRCE